MSSAGAMWKEGRQGAASLCYIGLDTATLTWVLLHHAAVGIRATVVVRSDDPLVPELLRRNWDLALDEGVIEPQLTAQDGREHHGWVASSAVAEAEPGRPYTVSLTPDVIAAPTQGARPLLPSQPIPADVSEAQAAIEEVVQREAWAIWRVDAATVHGWGIAGHQGLLGWLGEHHARIWCAPIRDIAAW